MCMNGGNLHVCALPACKRSFCDKCVKTPAIPAAKMVNVDFHCPGCHVDSEYKRKKGTPKKEQYDPAVYRVKFILSHFLI